MTASIYKKGDRIKVVNGTLGDSRFNGRFGVIISAALSDDTLHSVKLDSTSEHPEHDGVFRDAELAHESDGLTLEARKAKLEAELADVTEKIRESKLASNMPLGTLIHVHDRVGQAYLKTHGGWKIIRGGDDAGAYIVTSLASDTTVQRHIDRQGGYVIVTIIKPEGN